MKRIEFKSISMISERNQTARTVKFHPGRNLLYGANGAGKSTLLKTLYLTLGARSRQLTPAMDGDLKSLVEVLVDGVKFTVVHWAGNRALFEDNGALVGAAMTLPGWNDLFRNWLDFQLPVQSEGDQLPVLADSSCFFALFYLDQDVGWGRTIGSFRSDGGSIKRLPVAPIVDFFAGIRGNEYFRLRARIHDAEKALKVLKREQGSLERARKSLVDRIGVRPVATNIEIFQKESEDLAVRFGALATRQAQIQARLLSDSQLISSIRAQRRTVARPLAEFHKDWSYLSGAAMGDLACPTCGSAPQDLFGELLRYAQDVHVLENLDAQLVKDLAEAIDRVEKSKSEFGRLQAELVDIERIMTTQRAGATLGDVVNRLAANQAVEAFDSQKENLQAQRAQRMLALEDLRSRLAGLNEKARKREVDEHFLGAIKAYGTKLGVPSSPHDASMSARLSMSGSLGSRANLAHSAAIWRQTSGRYAQYIVPIVIDDPMQRGQDAEHAATILEFCREDLPQDNQVIVASEQRNAFLDTEVIQLRADDDFARKAEFVVENARCNPYFQAMLNELYQQQQ